VRRIGIVGGEQVVETALRIRERMLDRESQAPQSRRSDRYQESLDGLCASRQIRETLLNEFGTGKSVTHRGIIAGA
jgi:hypothetical protein